MQRRLYFIFFVWLLLLCPMTAGGVETRTATLQHGAQMTPFFGDSAFVRANRAAVDGDVITLSFGWFTPDTIFKSIRVYGQFGLGLSRPPYPEGAYVHNSIVVLADNVYIEGLDPSYIDIWANHCTVKRCWASIRIRGMNALVDQCSSTGIYFAPDNSKNCTIRNSTIDDLQGMTAVDGMATISNSVICHFYKNGDRWISQPYAIYTNCVLGLDAYTEWSPDHLITNIAEFRFQSPSEFHYNYLYRINSYYPESEEGAMYYVPYSFAPGCVNDHNVVSSENSSAIRGYGSCNTTTFSFSRQETFGPITGTDGKPVGIRGGNGYTVYPGIPRFSQTEIDTLTEINGTLHAQFYVKAEKENPEDDPSVVLFEYWLDNPYGEKQTIEVSNPAGTYSPFNPSIDCADLPTGDHMLYYRLKDSYGAYSPLYIHPFVRRNPYDDALYLPYDATEPVGDQKTANPTYSAYPTEIESEMPPMQCQ